LKIPIKLDASDDRSAKPSVRELLSSVDFNPLKGTIDLNGARIVMQRANVGHVMRGELRDLLGEEETRIFLMRQGYLTGRSDALFVQDAWPHLNIGDAFTAGTRLHTFTGTVRVETVHNDFDFKRGRFAGEFIWHDSVEAEQIAKNGFRSAEPCCWTLVGYASGYATAFFGKPILYKEMSCIAQGKKTCRVIGKPIDDWKADDPAVIRFRDRVIPREPVKAARPSRQTAHPANPEPIAGPVKAAVSLRLQANLPCILSGPDDSGRKRALSSLVLPDNQDPVWHDGANLTVSALQDARPSPKRPLLIDRVELCRADVQRQLALGKIPFHAVTTLSGSQLKSDPRFELAFFHLIAVGTVVMPAFRDRPRAGRNEILTMIATETAKEIGHPAPNPEVLAALAESDDVTGLSQLAGILRYLILFNGPPEEAVAAFTRPAISTRSDPRLSGWIEDTLATGLLDVNELERSVRTAALAREDGNLSAAARRLGLTRAQLAYRMKTDDGLD